MKNIAIIHYLVGGTDGVSLEIDKWKQVLESLGHRVFLIAGNLGNTDGILIDELYHHRPDIERLSYNTFIELRDYNTALDYQRELDSLTEILYNKLNKILIDNKIDIVIPHNIWSNSCSPPVSIALARVIRELGLPTIAHHHDFYWERIDGVVLTSANALAYTDKYMPPRYSNIKHVVINSLAQQELLERKGIRATVVPNMFDFEGLGWSSDEYNSDFRQRIGLKDDDIMILQATRIVPKKGIELAVDLVKALNDPVRRRRLSESGLYDGREFNQNSKIVLVLPGITRDEITGRYLEILKAKIRGAGVDAIFIEHLVDGYSSHHGDTKIYSLWDTYVHADFVTYPSFWEGWGNQFLEAVRARIPIALFEYPVFLADIKDNGFRVISFGSVICGTDDLGLVEIEPQRIETVADQTVETLINPQLRADITEHNFTVARDHFSLSVLREILVMLIDF